MVTSSKLQNDYYRYINAITNVMLTLNSAINFLIYCLVGKKFRRIFVAMMCDERSGLRRCGRRGAGGVAVPGEEENAVAAVQEEEEGEELDCPAQDSPFVERIVMTATSAKSDNQHRSSM